MILKIFIFVFFSLLIYCIGHEHQSEEVLVSEEKTGVDLDDTIQGDKNSEKNRHSDGLFLKISLIN